MLKDPTDLTNRKARRLGGTPASRVANLLAVSILATTGVIGCWLGLTDIEWIKRARKSLLEPQERCEATVLKTKMLTDPEYSSVIWTLNQRITDKLDGVYVPEQSKYDESNAEK